MINLEIKPHEGIGVIKLGTPRLEVRKIMNQQGFPLSYENGDLDYFCENSIQVEFDSDTASFIGISRHNQIHCTFQGLDVFDTGAENLFNVIKESEGDEIHKFDPSEYCFPNQILTLYEADEQYHKSESKVVYGQVGIGDKRYLEAIT